MKTKLFGLIASIALVGSGTALAGDDWKKHDKQQQTQSESSTGGSGKVTEGTAGQAGTSGQAGSLGQMDQGGSGMQDQSAQAQQGSTPQLGSNEIIGRVVKSSKKMVWVEHAGAIVPLKINKQTQFGDTNIKRAQDFQEGDHIRASFKVDETDNVATSIRKSDSGLGTGTGGSGTGVGSDIGNESDVMTPDSSLPPSPIDNRTGSDLTPPDVRDEGTRSDLGTDTSKDTSDY
jgi:hypothetical protein